MVFNATFNNISVIGGGNRRKPPSCRKSLTNFIYVEHSSPHEKIFLIIDHVNGIKKPNSL
jgi:hypothetical protein